MKGFLKSKLVLSLLALVLMAGVIAIPLSGSITRSHAAAAAPTIDPIVGDWNVTYGAPAMVTMTLSGGVYTVTAKTPVRVTGSSCDLPIGTIVATFSSTGGNAYSGQHGLWYTSDCSFGYWDSLSLTLSSDGNTLTGVLAGGYGTVTFTKASSATSLHANLSYSLGPFYDYFSNSVLKYASSLNPSQLSVDLDACGSQGASLYIWQFSGTKSTSTNCQLPTTLPKGQQSVTLTVQSSDGRTDTVTNVIDVKDFLMVSAGDSYASGEGNPDIDAVGCNDPSGLDFLKKQYTSVSCTNDPVWQKQAFSTGANDNSACHRSTLADGALAFQKLGAAEPKTAVNFLHVACSGAVADNLIKNSQSPKDPYSSLGYSIPTQFSQINRDRAGHSIDALVLSIGGNDIGFKDIITQCVSLGADPRSHLSDCGSSGTQDKINKDVTKKLSQLNLKLDQVAACIKGSPVLSDVNGTVSCPDNNSRLAMDPSRVFILGYPDPARGSDGTLCGNFTSILSSDAWSFAENSIIAKLNDLIGHKADYYGWHKIADFNNIPADISTSNSFLTHGYCAASTWFRPFLYDGGNTAGDQQLGTYDVQGDVDGVFHPNNEGHERMSESIAQSIQQVFF